MTKSEYEAYEVAIEHRLKGLRFISTGACPGCNECGLDEDCSDEERELAEEPGFSWSSCDACGSTLGGDRHPAHGVDDDDDTIHLNVCTDCVYYLNYGRLDDTTMMEIEEDTGV